MSSQTDTVNYILLHGCEQLMLVTCIYIRLIITYDTPHSGTMIYAVTLRNSSVSRYCKITCGWWNYSHRNWIVFE